MIINDKNPHENELPRAATLRPSNTAANDFKS
jgi:hypothetical protein